ncbi:hypothetical protein MED121_03736 [Marinomonas sp. MED121]|nr:hypothetical protein MED121_03736 [Marinomonas sp. MED121]
MIFNANKEMLEYTKRNSHTAIGDVSFYFLGWGRKRDGIINDSVVIKKF